MNLGRWRVMGEVARGGWGVIHRAEDAEGRAAAIKVLRPRSPDDAEEARARFLRERDLLSRLEHPHLVRLLDSGEIDGVPFLALEWLPGPDLQRRITEQGPLSIDDTIRIATQATDVLAFLHAAGVIHRDLKPANFSFDAGGSLRLLDLGLALDPVASPGLTAPGAFLGTVGYAAPEVAAGRPGTARSDLYGLGAVLYACLTGRPPHIGTTDRSVLRRQARDSVPSPSLLRAGIPPVLSELVSALLEAEPERRPRDAAGVLEALRALSSPVAAVPRPPPYPPPSGGRDTTEETETTETTETTKETTRPYGRTTNGASSGASSTDPTVIKGTPTPSPAASEAGANVSPDPRAGLPANRYLGAYELVRRIGQGGMGEVYLARDSGLRRDVAIKVLPAWLAERPELAARFEREAQVLAALHHEGILDIHSVGRDDGRPYIVTEYVAGASLEETLRSAGRLPARRAAEMVRKAAVAVACAHEGGILHRDLKPANLLVAPKPDGTERVVVVDFGLAGRVEGPGTLTRSGDLFGTPAYMAPEQATASVSRIGVRTDVYGLGAVLYALLVGAPPHPGDTVWRVLQHAASGEVMNLRHARADVHADLATIVERTLQSDPSRRYASAAELADDLQRYLDGEPIRARPVSLTTKLWLAARRRAGVLVPALLALVVVLGTLAWPSVDSALRTRRDRLAREDRQRDAEDRLRKAREEFAAGKVTEAEKTATALIRDDLPHFDQGEALPIPEAHALLAKVHSSRGESPQALRESFRAYRSAAGRPDARAYLLGAARELVEQGQFAQGQGMLRRVVSGGERDAIAAEATYWLARAALGLLAFEEASSLFQEAQARGLDNSRRHEAERLMRFCELLSGEVLLPFDAVDIAVADVDADGRNELLVCQPRRVLVGSIASGGEWSEKWHFDLPIDRNYDLMTIEGADLDGDHKAEIVIAGGSATVPGRLSILKGGENSGRLDEIAAVPIEGVPSPHAIAIGHMEGTEDSEIVLGTGAYTRELRVYTWRRSAHGLELRGRTPVGGDVRGISVADIDGDGHAELVAFAGPWSAYGISAYHWSGGDPVLWRHLDLGRPDSCLTWFSERGMEAVVANWWERTERYPLLRTLGHEEFDRRYRPPGVYQVNLNRDGETVIRALMEGSWEKGDEGRYAAVSISGRGSRFLWASGGMGGFIDTPPESAEGFGAGVLFEQGAGGWVKLAALQSDWRHTDSMFAKDLNGDGEDEVFHRSPHGITVRGIEGTRRSPPSPGSASAGISRTVAFTELDAARDAELAGLWDEALDIYESPDRASGERPRALEADRGALRCLVALHRWVPLVTRARAAAARWPGVEPELFPPCIEALAAARQWEAAAELAGILSASAGIDLARRRVVLEQEKEFRAQAHVVSRAVLIGSGAAQAEWLASSPLCVRNDPAGVTFFVASGSVQFLLAPVSTSGAGQSVEARGETRRADWGTHLCLSISDTSPWVHAPGDFSSAIATGQRSSVWGIGLSASGSTAFPLRRFFLTCRNVNTDEYSDFGSMEEDPPFTWRVEGCLLPYPDRVAGVVEIAGRRFERNIAVASGTWDEAFLGWIGNGLDAPGLWGVHRFESLDFRAAHDGNRLRPFVPVSALDHVYLANGRWVFGRTDEAGALYDKAVLMAEEDEARDRRVESKEASSMAPAPPAAGFSAWAVQEARICRGLFRAAHGDRAGSLEDLRRAWDFSPERFRRQVALLALPLRDQPVASEAFRNLILDREGKPGAGAITVELVDRVFRECGEIDEVVESLFGPLGFRVARSVEVERVEPDTPASEAGLAAGDRVLSVNGADIRTDADLRAGLREARRTQAKTAHLRLFRTGAAIEVDVDPGLTGAHVTERAEIQGAAQRPAGTSGAGGGANSPR